MTLPSYPYFPTALDALYSTFEGVEADDGGSVALATHDPSVMSAKFVYKPFQDEILNLIDMSLMQGGIRVRNETGGTLTYTATPLIYFSGFKNNVISGDASTQLSSMTLYGVRSTNSLHWRLYWSLTNSGTTRTFNLYRDSAKTILVAHGTRTNDGVITLTADNSSGITGVVTVAYTQDDTDSSNYIDCNLFLIGKADPTDPAKAAHAVLNASLANNTNGIAYGEQDVTGLDTSAASAVGSKVYLSSTVGGFTFSDPGLLYGLQAVGFVSAKDASTGSIRFMPSRRFIERMSGAANYDMNNMAINGSFRYAQYQDPTTLTNTTDNDYAADDWKTTRENTQLQFVRTSGVGVSGITSKYYGSYKKTTSTGKAYIFKIIEGTLAQSLLGKTVIFQASMKASSAKTIRMGVIELANAGTIDTIPNPFVTAFGANSTDPTLGTNLAKITPNALGTTGTIASGAASQSVTTAFQVFSVSVTLPADSKNFVLAIWTDSQFAANDQLDIAEAGFYLGNAVRPWVYDEAADLLKCQRFFCKSFEVDTAPAQNSGTEVGTAHNYCMRAAAVKSGVQISFPVTMRAIPTMTYYSPAAASTAWYNYTSAAASGASSSQGLSSNGVAIENAGAAGDALSDRLAIHWSAKAVL